MGMDVHANRLFRDVNAPLLAQIRSTSLRGPVGGLHPDLMRI
jgi:hypothetical protein